MKHLGDITKINGADVPPVEIITGGSPCQDLSVAGKRAGLAGERSGLFMEQIRIIKEMRDNDRANGRSGLAIRPRYMVWENVPGAFSSNNGEDFRAVLEETARVADSSASIPRLPKGEGWSNSGAIMGDGWSIAWRVHDAQFWGVPQRRKRISLVADFAGASALEILFERESLSGDSQPSTEKGQGIARDAEGRSRETGKEEPVTYRGDSITHPTNKSNPQPGDPCHTLTDDDRNYVVALEGNGMRASHHGAGYSEDGKMYTLNAVEQHVVGVYDASRRHDYQPFGDVSETVQAQYGTGGNNQPLVVSEVYDGRGKGNGKVSPSLVGDHQRRITDFTALVTYGLDLYNQSQTPDVSMSITGAATDPHHIPCTYHGGGSVVRRLTPTECERLQGYPDGWTDIGEWVDSKGKTHKGDSDSPRYKALGNSIALPFWQWMAERMVKILGVDSPTMASLFDGIGGFPLVFSRVGCLPACVGI